MLIKEIIFEAKPQAPKPRNFVAKAAQTVAKGAGATSAANVAIGPVYKNKPAKSAKNKNGTAKNALDMPGTNLITGGSIKRR